MPYCRESYQGIHKWLKHAFSRLVFYKLRVVVVLKCFRYKLCTD